MRLKPPITTDAALAHLSSNAVAVWGDGEATKLQPHLQSIAAAMATVSALDIPDEVEPLFGEDIGQDALEAMELDS